MLSSVVFALPPTVSVALVAGVRWEKLPGILEPFDWELRATAAFLSWPGFAVCHWVGLNFFSMRGQLLGQPVCLLAYHSLRTLWRRQTTEGKRRVLLYGSVALATAGLVGAMIGRAGRNRLVLTRIRLRLRDLPEELEGLRVLLMSDLHCGPLNSPHFLAGVVRRVNRLNPDLVLLPGDFVEDGPRWAEAVGRVLERLSPRIGVAATLGNHDHWKGGADEVRRALRAAGVRLVENDRVFLGKDGTLGEKPGEEGLLIAGVGDLWHGEVNLEKALDGVPQSVPRLLLSHNPDVAEQPTEHRVDLMLSGHTHGGQFQLPGIGAPTVPSRYGEKYTEGWVEGPSWPVYVTRGIGTIGIPIRVHASPELALFELVRG